jgi:trehalose-phosphatase
VATDSKERVPDREYDAVIFDLDGVLTDTASLHFKAWKEMFDDYLQQASGPEAKEEFTEADYRKLVDGKPRYDGVESFLNARGISLPYGDPGDSPDRETICGLGNRKNKHYHRILKEGGVTLFDATLPVLRRLERAGVAMAVVSSSRNTHMVLESAGIQDRFQTIVDGNDLAKLGLPGKPDPALFLEAARRMDVDPPRAVVVEDATSGVRAGREGGFGLVVGVDRNGAAEALMRAGADLVVTDIGDLPFFGGESPVTETRGKDSRDENSDGGGKREQGRKIRDLPPALERKDEIADLLAGAIPAVFLDYDGTLTPIVEDPTEAQLSEETRTVLRALARRCALSIVSGRDRWDVQKLVDVEGLIYAGSHGFDVKGPEGLRDQRGDEFLPALDEAARRLTPRVEGVEGASVERKRYAVAVHFREAGAEAESRIREWVDDVEGQIPELRVTGGKMIFELRPDMDWDKGKAIRHLLNILGLKDERAAPIYIGDDLTDEDAFREVQEKGVGVVVRGEDDDRETAAKYSLDDPSEVRDFLNHLVESMERIRA